MNEETYSGYVAIIGRPNVGKSTLLNVILGKKISITSHKPQTTRQRILGVKTQEQIQVLYVDTPGLHQAEPHKINQYMNRTALRALADVDVVVWIVEALRWLPEDEWILTKLKEIKKPVILVVNKVDQAKPKTTLLSFLAEMADKMNFTDIVPISAQSGDNVLELEKVIAKKMPLSPHFFPADQITDRSERFLASEIIREKITRLLHKELPYSVAVEIEEFKTEEKILRISAIIWIEREGQKAIVIGEQGVQLKNIGTAARLAMERLFQQKVFLRLWVRVKKNWSDDERILHSLGYDE